MSIGYRTTLARSSVSVAALRMLRLVARRLLVNLQSVDDSLHVIEQGAFDGSGEQPFERQSDHIWPACFTGALIERLAVHRPTGLALRTM